MYYNFGTGSWWESQKAIDALHKNPSGTSTSTVVVSKKSKKDPYIDKIRTKNGKRAGIGRFLKKFGKSFKRDTKLGHYINKHKGTVALGALGAAVLAKKMYNDNRLMDQYKDAIMSNRSLRRKVMGI